MTKVKFRNQLKGAFIVPLGLAIVLVPFSLLFGWNILTAMVFWFFLVPVLAIYLPARVSKNQNHLPESAAGLLTFYATMVWMIYDHYQSDYFQVMLASCVINLIVITITSLPVRPKIPS